jgi:hypothetical protein
MMGSLACSIQIFSHCRLAWLCPDTDLLVLQAAGLRLYHPPQSPKGVVPLEAFEISYDNPPVETFDAQSRLSRDRARRRMTLTILPAARQF